MRLIYRSVLLTLLFITSVFILSTTFVSYPPFRDRYKKYERRSVTSSRNLYRTYKNAFPATKSINHVVCLATIGDLKHLNHLEELSTQWTGPASVAVFTNKKDAQLVVQYLSFIRSCHPALKERFAFHLIVPRNESVISQFEADTIQFPKQCNAANHYLQDLLAQQKTNQSKFPQNHLRNIARDGCWNSDYFILTDIDVMPVTGLADQFAKYHSTWPPCDRCIYVTPAYEISENASIPRTKAELLKVAKNKKIVRVYHSRVFPKNQRATNHSAWTKLPISEQLQPAYKANFEIGYEAFYIAPHTVPRHVERFVGYGFTRNTQLFLTHLERFEFWVLNNAFVVHRGLQDNNRVPHFRAKERTSNYYIYTKWFKEIKMKYPQAANFKP